MKRPTISAGEQMLPEPKRTAAQGLPRPGELSTPAAPLCGKSRREPLTLRGHAAYLRLFNEWRHSNKPRGAVQFEPEPAKVTAALEAVTEYVLAELNAKWAAAKTSTGGDLTEKGGRA